MIFALILISLIFIAVGFIVTERNAKYLLSGYNTNVTMRTNGYAQGLVRKGYFKTENGEIIKLLVDTDQAPFLRIEKKNGEKIYFAAKGKSIPGLMGELKQALKGVEFIEH